jgi:hypothetical protein
MLDRKCDLAIKKEYNHHVIILAGFGVTLLMIQRI